MNEQQPQPTSAETGSVSAASDAKTGFNTEPVMAESPTIAPDQEMTSPKDDAPKVDAPREEPTLEAPRVEASRVDARSGEMQSDKNAKAPRPAGNIVIMAPGERMSPGGGPAGQAAPRRRVAAMAAVVALAAVAGAVGGALATAGLGQSNAGEAATARNAGLEAAVARIDADILALKASVEQNAKLGVTQFNKTSDRLEKVEKAQAEPATRLAKLSEEISKLRAVQTTAAASAAAPAAAASIAPKDITGSVAPAAAAAPPASAANAKVEVGRLPTVEGWVLREVGRGSALIESRRGLYEVFAGDPIPGLGRVDAIRKQDGRWVVVTSRGLIVAR